MSTQRAAGKETTGIDETVSLREYAALERELSALKEDFSNYRGAMSKKLDSVKTRLRKCVHPILRRKTPS